MAKWTLELDHAGIGAYLRGPEVAAGIRSLAERVAGAHAEATVDTDVSDRARARVSIPIKRGVAADELGGALIAAATAAGLEVRRRA